MADKTHGIVPPGYRLPADTHPGAVHLQVADLDRSLEYYRSVLGMHLVERAAGHARLGAAGSREPLVELRERPGARPVPPRGRIGLYHFAILLPDRPALGAFVRHLAELGIPAGMSDHAVSEAVYLSDPDGLGIEVYADRPRSSWRTRGDELFMTTEPLDVAALLAAAPLPWVGLPAGTVIGHVHLFVRDLDAAAAFYHGALGFDKVVWSYPGALFLAAGGYHHHLGTNTWAAGAPLPAPDDACLLEWTLRLPAPDDVARAAASLASAGFAVSSAGDSCLAADPWGTRVRLTA